MFPSPKVEFEILWQPAPPPAGCHADRSRADISLPSARDRSSPQNQFDGFADWYPIGPRRTATG